MGDMKKREVITIVVAVLVVGLLFVVLKLSGNNTTPPPAETSVAESASANPTPSNESAEPSADTAQPADNSVTLPLSDADVERLLEEAVAFGSFEERSGLHYQTNESEPYSGWAKSMYDSGQVGGLTQFKEGNPDGLSTWWHENGQKQREGTFKDGKQDGLMTEWHDNGQKKIEVIYKDGERVSEKYWNSKGEEVETPEEAEE